MLTIGDFARHGRVSVRMLRHYDAIGLLRPARVDPASGYRLYAAAQLTTLNRVIALKDLGFTLQQVGTILTEQVSAGELRGMLRLRRAELEPETDLPGIKAATIVHRGSMDTVVGTDQLMARWLETGGHRAIGYPRELYIECPPGALDQWVTELQTPIATT